LLEIKPEILPNHNKKITLTDKLGIMMRYPTIELLSSIQADDTSDLIIQLIVDSVDYIFDGDEIYYSKDTSREELVEFIETLQQKDLDKIKEFFDTSPKIKKQLDFKCKKCGHEEKIVVEGINNFFV
jgi:DNA-directed RNA polymerase subunit M/transcription elongation factor TFIIS